MKALATFSVAILGLAFQGAVVGAHATTASGHCTGMTITDFLSSDTAIDTSSTTWQNVTDGHLNFTTSGTGCVAITFAGIATVTASDTSYEYLRVRTLLDGTNLCVPALYNDIFFSYGGSSAEPVIAGSITRVCKNVAPGAHTLQVQFHSGGGNDVVIASHTLTVTHN